jgi:hypothetical protein
VKRLIEKARWRLADLVNRLPGQCWTRLVGFAMGDSRSPWQPQDWMCRDGAMRTGACYCGKLRPKGGES